MTTEDEQEQKSRSQLKREFAELRELVYELTKLSAGQLEQLPLDPRTREEVLDAGRMSRAALQRQVRYVVRLLESEDVDAVREALSNPLPKSAAKAPSSADLWCEQLIDGDDAFLQQFTEEHPEFDRQRLRQLSRSARRERDQDKPSTSATKLLEILREKS